MSFTLPNSLPEHVYVIAEIGINHNGDLDIARKLIDMAKACDCDAVKFQKRSIEKVYSPEELEKPRESPWGTTQREQKEGLEFGRTEYDEIAAYCADVGIDWFASAWDEDSQKFLQTYDMAHNKIASAILTHPRLPAMIADEGRHTFISIGMSTYGQIDEVVNVFKKKNCPFTLMYSVSEYPCPKERNNIAGMLTLRQRYGCPVGYSGHETGVLASIIASSYGATAIERHITLNRAMYGSDQPASLERRGLEILVNYVRAIPVTFGTGERIISDQEMVVAKKLRYWEN